MQYYCWSLDSNWPTVWTKNVTAYLNMYIQIKNMTDECLNQHVCSDIL